ncbi:MAG TPA: DNA-binding response regulator [Clostridiales bacterium]|uniref:Stage 0 sporulation protein A homolog n=1 Tax=Candidatus Egerieisoma faecipullorum TaxID=2840963 RepID=A0A9D1LBR8_9CLOT|nr:DNA-binding response regulator [Clostridiales bacterium]HIU30503.1 response regulator transcription factor [Candidatus Egerieisoma faecipullorum]
MEKILVIEDDESIRLELAALLRANGYLPVDKPPCDLALIDINLPGESGYELCRKLRQHSDAPVIFLTAREAPEDELLGFSVGADDYIRKPYHSSVLLARIARLLKRTDKAVLTVRDLTLDLSNLTLVYKGRREELTKNETRILACLMKKELCTRDEIIEDLWNNSLYVDDNTLSVNINRLREKLKRLGAEGYLRTVRGVGYRL